jgi:Tfp pilus assembly ATPase PilU
MQTFNQALATAYFQKQVSLETALQRSSNQDELQEMINRGASLANRGGSTGSGMARGAAPSKG